jgi:hypothetical protein
MVAVERVCPVAGVDGVEVFGDGNVHGDVVEEGVALVIWPTWKRVRKVCLPRSPFDGVFITPDFLDPSGLPAIELPLVHESGQALVVGVDCRLSTLEVAAPFAEGFNERVELLFPSGVAGDGVRMFPGEKADGVRLFGRGWALK